MNAPPQRLDQVERQSRLRLARTPKVGPLTFRALLSRYGSATAALEALPSLAQTGARKLTVIPPSVAEAELARINGLGAKLIVYGEDDYPQALAAIEDAPPTLCIQGQIDLLHQPIIAMVGARNASASAKRLAEQWAAELGSAGWIVVSGLARGIDGAAHRGALATGTIACVAGGIDIIYPPEHGDLQAAIAERGVVVTECPPGTKPTGRHFPRRNRLISGLARGVVVVEAASRSGSLITARLAGEQGREVFAVPGSPLDPRNHGTNRLIRNGAALVQSVDDILEELEAVRPVSSRVQDERRDPPESNDQPSQGELASARAQIEESLSPTPTPVDELIRDCQLSASVVQTVLLELELAGKIARQPGSRISLI
ncbi:MAG: DNA-processing protein DprA [Pseudomonadota bacterium]